MRDGEEICRSIRRKSLGFDTKNVCMRTQWGCLVGWGFCLRMFGNIFGGKEREMF